MSVVPSAWMPAAKMQRIICHWTAGRHKATSVDKAHYHLIIEGDGTVVRGDPSIKLNESPAKKGYAAHTLNCNSGSIGVSMACMWDAKESPFQPGPAPMTKVQWDKMIQCVGELCARYAIPVTPQTVLSHAEVQPNLKITQRGKWDFTRLAFDPTVVGAKACGDKLRREVQSAITGDYVTAPQPSISKPSEPISPAPATTHKVVAGDTWSGLAKRYGIGLDRLLAWNDADPKEYLLIGRVVRLTGPVLTSPAPKAPEPAKPAPAAPQSGRTLLQIIIDAITAAFRRN